MEQSEEPFITFFQLFPNAPVPRRADAALLGSIPLRAHRYCEPFTTGCGFGWYGFPPTDFALLWDGTNVFWKPADQTSWQQFDTVVFPGFPEHYTRHAPAHIAKFAGTPFLADAPEPGIIQIWTGLMIKTRPDWAILVRGVANMPRDPAFEVLDGIIETDWWVGPAVTPIRLCKTDQPILFRARRPLFQIQPVLKHAYNDTTLDSSLVVDDLATLRPDDWQAFEDAIMLRNAPGARSGTYKLERRRRAGLRHQADKAKEV